MSFTGDDAFLVTTCVGFGHPNFSETACPYAYVLSLRDVVTGERVAAFTQRTSVDGIVCAPGGGYIATLGFMGGLYLWNIRTRSEVHLQCKHPVSHITFSSDGETLMAACGQYAQLWDVETGQSLLTIGHDSDVQYASLSVDGALACTCDEQNAWIWKLAPREAPHQPTDPVADALSLLSRNPTTSEWEAYIPEQPYQRLRNDID